MPHKDPERAKAYFAEYHKKHREKRKKYLREYFSKNRAIAGVKGKDYYEKNRDEIRAKQKEYRRRPEVMERSRILSRGYRKIKKSENYSNGWKKRNPKKYGVHQRTLRAVRLGRLKRPEKCERCGETCKPDAHHENYDKPMEVLWLCKLCHGKRHRKYK
jgi:hypothetical protein